MTRYKGLLTKRRDNYKITMDGIINVYKEAGFTSFDVVAKLRGILKQKKIGHTGTLDPDAEGVLPVCVGKATKVCGYLTEKDKTYQARLRLGLTTDTQDLSGNVLSEQACGITEEKLLKVICGFTGRQEQVPPMYSALKVNGRKLCDLARQGIEVERKAREIEIYSIEVLAVNLPCVTMRVHCSKGAYIRTLCHDIGLKAGCGGCMEKLLRTKAAGFSIERSLRLHEIEAIVQGRDADGRQLLDIVTPVERVLEEYPRADAKRGMDKRIRNGGSFFASETSQGAELEEGICRLYDAAGEFIGLFRHDAGKGLLVPEKMFV